jgi:hypothetical protein
MRAELIACGKPGFFRNDICREVTRWRYCHPDRWRTVAECAVESFPQPLSSVISRPFYAEAGSNGYSRPPLRSRV